MGFEIALIVMGVLIGIIGFISLIVSVWLCIKYHVFNKKENSAGLTGVEVARKILDSNDLQHIKVKVTGSLLFGNSYSHIFKKVRLRRFTKNKTSLTSLGMGAQKSCLAILDKEGDKDMRKRIRLYPLITFGPFMFIPLIAIGALLDYFMFNSTGVIIYVLGAIGFLFYVYAVVLTITTLKTEKKAQEKAYEILQRENLVTEEELTDLKELFHLYNVQYVNDIILASLELIYRVLEIAFHIAKESKD